MRRLRAGSSSAAGFAYRRVEERISSSTTTRPFASSVAPVAVLSTMTSASSGGNTSVAPYERTHSAESPRSAIQRRASRSYSDATTRRRAGRCPSTSRVLGVAATTCRSSSVPKSTTPAPGAGVGDGLKVYTLLVTLRTPPAPPIQRGGDGGAGDANGYAA